MELTLDAVENPFGLSLDDDETANLTRLGSDPHVRRVLVLPSFKLKKETLRWLGRDIRNTRCDDTVVLADGLHPRYANYEIGCGFFSVLVDLDATPETSRGITEAVRRFVRAHNGFGDRVRRVTSARLSTGRRASVSFRHPFSIRPAEWASMVSGGVAAFLASRDDPYEWLGSLEAFGASGNHFTGRIETLRDLLDPTWVDGRRQYSHDGGPLRFTGSHYLDLLQVRDITPEGGASFLDTPFGGRLNAPLAPGKLVLMLHAHGTNFGQVLRENALRRVGMSHNLKRYLHRHAQASRQEAAAVTTMEVRAAGHGALGKRLRHRPHIEETTHRAISNPRVADLVASMAATGSIVPLASMRPVLRLHTVRPGEKPFAARAAQGGVR